jgi:hypothetical protein
MSISGMRARYGDRLDESIRRHRHPPGHDTNAVEGAKDYTEFKSVGIPLPSRNKARRTQYNTMRYFDLKRHWTRRILPKLRDPLLNRVLTCAFKLYVEGAYPGRTYNPLTDTPITWCNVDLRNVRNGDGTLRRGKEPRYFAYVCFGACHWLANFELRLGQLVAPRLPWRILKGTKHSTVWDGDNLLLDFNYYAGGYHPADCFNDACVDCIELEVGEFLVNTLATPPWEKETYQLTSTYLRHLMAKTT